MAKLDPENVYFYAIVTLFLYDLYGVIKPSKCLGGDPRIPAIQVTYEKI